MGLLIQQSTSAYKIPFLLVLSSDHISPATGKSPTVTISKNGAAFAAPSGAVTELSGGWYLIAGNATDSNTLGALCVHVTEASSDNSDEMHQVVAQDLTANNVVQTGDSFARLGAPTGASIAADIQEVEGETDAIQASTAGLTFTVANQVDCNVLDWKSATAPAMTGDAFARLGAPAGASVSADIAEIEAETDTLLAGVTVTTNNDKTGYTASTVTDKTGYRLDATGSATLTESYAAKGAAATLPALLYSLLQALTEFSTSGTTVTIKKRDQATTAFTETVDSATAPTSITQAT